MARLAGKTALITGATGGIGEATAKRYLEEGVNVVLAGRSEAKLKETRERLSDYSSITESVGDAADEGAVQRAVSTAVKQFGGLDILVNNVGKAGGGDITAATDEDWQAAFNATLYPAIRASRAAVPHLRKRKGSVIIMITSIWGRESGGRMTYNAVKAAEISLGKSMAQQLAPEGIRVLSLAPGSILFPGGSWHTRQQADPEGIAKFIEDELPFGRFGRPEEIGEVVAFLASSRASWVSGACIPVDGCQSRSLI